MHCYKYGFQSDAIVVSRRRSPYSIWLVNSSMTDTVAWSCLSWAVCHSKYTKRKNTRSFPNYSCFVDLRKAFDTLWHRGRLYKLLTNNVGCKFINVTQNIYGLCQSAIKIDNKHSDYFKIERGVKQRDSWSSYLFNCFVNGLYDIFDESCGPLKLENTVISSFTFCCWSYYFF